MIRVFTDTAANLPPEVLEKYHIRTLPLTYRVDGELPEGEFDGPGVLRCHPRRCGGQDRDGQPAGYRRGDGAGAGRRG